MIHPKLFYYPSTTTLLYLGYSGAIDDREGGDMRVLNGSPDSIHKYYESNRSQRHTGEYLLEHFFKDNAKFTLKGNLSLFNRDNSSNTVSVNGNQTSYYNEASVFVPVHKIDIVAGINAVGDKYTTISPDSASLRGYDNFTMGIFGQFDIHIKDKTTIEGGLRLDNHKRYGLFALPRIAIFHRIDEHWAARSGFGMGYKTPNPLVQQNIEYSVLDLLPVNNSVKSEVSYGYNAEFNYKRDLAEHTSIFINQAFFLTQIDNPIIIYRNSIGKIDLVNASSSVVSKGFDSYIKLDIRSWELYLGYTFTDARNTYLPSNTFVPLTPKNRGAFILVKEIGDLWRIGLEGSYIGQQYRYDATTTPSYFFMAAMIQRNIGKHFIIVLNGENLLDYRMSKVESLYTGSITSPTFKPLWAPIDGRVINFSVRWKL
jgi:iron complex outermembrane receptor protein/outer membrane receptor for ferrienterochelin and colicins